MVESREAKNKEDLEFIVEILIAFFSLEANAIDLWLMASTINGFTTEKDLMKQREIVSFHLVWGCRALVERRGPKRVCVCFHQIIEDLLRVGKDEITNKGLLITFFERALR